MNCKPGIVRKCLLRPQTSPLDSTYPSALAARVARVRHVTAAKIDIYRLIDNQYFEQTLQAVLNAPTRAPASIAYQLGGHSTVAYCPRP